MSSIKIPLRSRNGEINSYLIEIESNKYSWYPAEDVYYRVSADESGVIFIDPDGGPFISKGSVIGSLVVDKIEKTKNAYVICTKSIIK